MPGEIDRVGPRVLHRNPDYSESILAHEGNSVQPSEDEHTGIDSRSTYWHRYWREPWRVRKRQWREWRRRRLSRETSITIDSDELVQCAESDEQLWHCLYGCNTVEYQGNPVALQRLPSLRLDAVETALRRVPESPEESSQCPSSSKDHRYSLSTNRPVDYQHGVISTWFVDSCDARDECKFKGERRKTKWPSMRHFYFDIVLLLLLIVIGHTRVVRTNLGIATVGTVIGIVGAGPVDLDAGIRAERSANLSHITGASRKIRMYIKNRHLQILPDGMVNGSNDDTSDYSEYIIFIINLDNLGEIKVRRLTSASIRDCSISKQTDRVT